MLVILKSIVQYLKKNYTFSHKFSCIFTTVCYNESIYIKSLR